MMKTKSYKGSYRSRQTRYQFLLLNFGNYIAGAILDVGCDEAYLRTLSNIKYVGIDKTGNPDVVFDLEKVPLPFKNKEFDSVCCLDVLEHLNNPHEVFDELARVSRRNIIVSLPNNFYLWERLRILRGSSPNNYYGLPPDVPQDRHKWFFNINDATEFIRYRGQLNGFYVKKEFSFYKTDGFLGPLRSIFKKIGLFPNFFAMAYWALLERE